MEAKAPKRRNGGSPRVNIQSFNNSLRILLSKEESKINNTSNNLISDEMFVIIDRFYDIHSIGTSEIIDMEDIVSLSQQIKWIISICL
jgi:hypothetical protein